MQDTKTYCEISDVVTLYVEGMCQNDPAKLREAMHEEMCCIGHYGGGLEWDKRHAFMAGVNDAVEAPDLSPWYVISSISIVGDIATVQVENVWLGEHYDDILTLLYHDEKWVIVSKVFHLRPAP